MDHFLDVFCVLLRDQQGFSEVLYWRMSARSLSHRVFCVGPHTLSGLSGVLAHLAEVGSYRVGWTNLSLLTSGYIGWWVGLTFKVRVPTLTSTGPVGVPRDFYFGSNQICLICDPRGWFSCLIFCVFLFVCFVLFCFMCVVMTVRSEMIWFISWPNLAVAAALSALVCHVASLRSRILPRKKRFMSFF